MVIRLSPYSTSIEEPTLKLLEGTKTDLTVTKNKASIKNEIIRFRFLLLNHLFETTWFISGFVEESCVSINYIGRLTGGSTFFESIRLNEGVSATRPGK